MLRLVNSDAMQTHNVNIQSRVKYFEIFQHLPFKENIGHRCNLFFTSPDFSLQISCNEANAEQDFPQFISDGRGVDFFSDPLSISTLGGLA